MEIRLLKKDEYPMLKDLPGQLVLDPDSSIVAVVIVDGKIKGRMVVLNLPHIEGAWIDPEIRKGLTLARMETLLTKELKKLGAKVALAYAVNKEMESYIQRLGYKHLASAWIKEI
jgi:hypothetical protein